MPICRLNCWTISLPIDKFCEKNYIDSQHEKYWCLKQSKFTQFHVLQANWEVYSKKQKIKAISKFLGFTFYEFLLIICHLCYCLNVIEHSWCNHSNISDPKYAKMRLIENTNEISYGVFQITSNPNRLIAKWLRGRTVEWYGKTVDKNSCWLWLRSQCELWR